MNCIPIRNRQGAIECDRCGAPFPVTAAELALFPGCAESLACIKSQCYGVGLGDRLARILKRLGITQYRLRKWLGLKCRCAARQEKLNRWGWRLAKRLGLVRRNRAIAEQHSRPLPGYLTRLQTPMDEEGFPVDDSALVISLLAAVVCFQSLTV
jgi:hypothetical protein